MARHNIDKTRRKTAEIAEMARDAAHTTKKDHKRHKLVVDHKSIAHQMVKVINTIPVGGMHPIIKKIMTLRLIGQAPEFMPLTIWQVAVSLAMTSDEVQRLEEEGAYITEQWIRKHNVDDSVKKFNMEKKASSAIIT
jgi:hypothetical protein